MIEIKFKMLDERAVWPKFQTEGAAAVDLHAIESVWIEAQDRKLIKSGLAFEIPEGYVGLVCSRSGLALKNGIIVLNAPGVIDCDYRGDVGAVLYNTTNERFLVVAGDRIAQFMIVPQPKIHYTRVGTLSDTTRGTGGFGSTGKQ